MVLQKYLIIFSFIYTNFFVSSKWCWYFSLYYANVSVGTPSVSYWVALDTGSDLFWLPCDCNNSTCETSLQTSSGQVCYCNNRHANVSCSFYLLSTTISNLWISYLESFIVSYIYIYILHYQGWQPKKLKNK